MCEPREAAGFCGARAPSVTYLCDRTKAAYAAYGLTEGSAAQLYGPEAIAGYAKAALRGYLPGRGGTADTVRMMPGTFAIDATGTIRAAHYARHAGDQPDLRGMLASLRGK
jgi:hypothetical protein